MNVIKSVCVFCAASRNLHRSYCQAATLLGEILASNNILIKYGGAAGGLMGHLADGALRHRGTVIGIIPDFMRPLESTHPGISKLVTVSSMQERKKLMRKDTDAAIALPGGTGTMEELLEVITLKRLGSYSKPIIMVNSRNYYADFLMFFGRMVEERFLGTRYRTIFSIVDRPEEVIPTAQYAPKWNAGESCQK